MKKKIDLSNVFIGILTIILIAMIVFLANLLTGNINSYNGVRTDTNCAEWFVDTGIDVKNYQNRVYNIVKDDNGWLYYCSDVTGELTPVINEFGLPTKDITIFD